MPTSRRPFTFDLDAPSNADGAVIASSGRTVVLCTASFEERVPRHRVGKGGWLTGEYSLLPGSTKPRGNREAARGRQGGRTMEIQRLVGRSLRMAVDIDRLGERTCTVDCDVLRADGGTRTAAITGGAVALYLAIHRLLEAGVLEEDPRVGLVAAISAGLVDGALVLDLDYAHDSEATMDMNVIGDERGRLVEIQGTAEGEPVDRAVVDGLVDLSLQGIGELVEAQRDALLRAGAPWPPKGHSDRHDPASTPVVCLRPAPEESR